MLLSPDSVFVLLLFIFYYNLLTNDIAFFSLNMTDFFLSESLLTEALLILFA